MGIRKTVYFLIFIILALIVVSLILQMEEMNHENIHNGVLDLSTWSYDNVIDLNGEAEFYWEKLLTKNGFTGSIKPDCMPVVSSVWNYYKLKDGTTPSGKGYATYRIRVTGVKPWQPLAVRLQPFSTAYKFYIDDELLASCGIVGTTESNSCPHYAVNIVEFTPKSDQFDIIVQISNFTYARGGLWYPIAFGTPDQIKRLDMSVFGLDIFQICLFALLFVYNVFYCILRRDKYIIILIIMDILLICRTVSTGSLLSTSLMPLKNVDILIWLSYIPICCFPSTCLIVLYHYFSVDISKKIVFLCVGFSAFTTAAALILPVYLFTQFTYAIQIFIIWFCLYNIWKLTRALIRGYPHISQDIMFMLIGIIALTLTSLRDILYNENLLRQGHMEFLPFGFIIFSLLWDMSITYRYETLIKDRLLVLKELNVTSERERVLELRFLKSQIRPHFINNALNTIISISRTDIDRGRLLLAQFSNYLRGCYDYENLQNTIPIEQELDYVRSYLALEQARFLDNLHVEYSIDDIPFNVPPLSLQPLVENAIVHNKISKRKPLSLIIYVIANENAVKIGVMDNGQGFDPETIPSLLSGKWNSSSVGIKNINQRLIKIYDTKLHIENREGGGSNVYMLIPISENIEEY